jgi:disulfide bond formation protein DsbB
MERPVYAEVLTHFLALATIAGAVIVALGALYVGYLVLKQRHTLVQYGDILRKIVLPFGFVVSFGGVFLTLFYSQVLHYAPCDLCWYQRVFLYPQAFLFAYAWWRKDLAVLPYTLLLSVVGFVIALYHHMLQIGYDLMKPCSTAPFAVDCSKPSFIEFGFVTFPFMAVVLFGFLALVTVIALQGTKK